MPLPDRIDATRLNKLALLFEFGRDPYMPKCWPVHSYLEHRVFDHRIHSVLQDVLFPADLLQTGFTLLLALFLEAVESVS
jgi:hypothetical protein